MATTTQPYTGNNNRGKGTAPFSDLSFSFDYLWVNMRDLWLIKLTVQMKALMNLNI